MANIFNPQNSRNGNFKEELLVFGYSCKLFRDDDKAQYIENGQHLIPCMADQSLMVDRYDVRGTLYDLQAAAASGTPEGLSEVETREEELCEQERYLALYHDLDAIREQEEEETKRLTVEIGSGGEGFNQVGFSYDANTAPVPEQQQQQQQEEEDLPTSHPQGYTPQAENDTFIPSPTLLLPGAMVVPETIKHHKVIVKTAKFIASQGSQMEIVLKTKQANNVMFGFLSFDNPLNSYYKHLISLIKSGRYREEEQETKTPADAKIVNTSFNPPESAPGAQAAKSSSKSLPAPDCAYSKLISKIRENQAKSGINIVASDSRSQSPIVETRESTPVSTPVVSSTPVTVNKPIVGLVDYPSFNRTNDGDTTNSDDSDTEDTAQVAPINGNKKIKQVSNFEDFDTVPWPDSKTQIAIDKIACYVVKNGNRFEQAIRSRGDVRFKFLESNHKFNSYFQLKRALYKDIFASALDKSLSKKKSQSTSDMKAVVEGAKCSSRAISFSIRQRREQETTLPATSFPLESSSSEEETDEMTQEEKEKRKQAKEDRRKWRTMKREQFEREKREKKEERERKEMQRKEELHKRKLKELEEQENASGNEEIYDIFKYAQESGRDFIPADGSENSQQPDNKLRRKKAAHAFLSKLKDTEEEPKIIGPQLPPTIAAKMMESSPPNPPTPPSPSLTPPLPPSSSPPPPANPKPAVENEPLTSILPAVNALKNENRLTKSTLLAEALSSVLANEAVGETLCNKEDNGLDRDSRSRKRKLKSRSRDDESPSPDRLPSKRRKHHSRHHHKKHHKHRSSHKKSSHKKRSKSRKEKSKKKRSRRHRSISVSSSSSFSSSSRSSSVDSYKGRKDSSDDKSDTDQEVQVISDTSNSSRASSIVSVKSVSKEQQQNSTISSRASSTSREGHLAAVERKIGSSGTSSPVITNKPLSNFSTGVSKSPLPSSFDLKSSSAMAKITQGLRAKVHALMDKK